MLASALMDDDAARSTAENITANPAAGQQMSVKVPADGSAGSVLQVRHNGQTLQVTVPPGIAPGQSFLVDQPGWRGSSSNGLLAVQVRAITLSIVMAVRVPVGVLALTAGWCWAAGWLRVVGERSCSQCPAAAAAAADSGGGGLSRSRGRRRRAPAAASHPDSSGSAAGRGITAVRLAGLRRGYP